MLEPSHVLACVSAEWPLLPHCGQYNIINILAITLTFCCNYSNILKTSKNVCLSHLLKIVTFSTSPRCSSKKGHCVAVGRRKDGGCLVPTNNIFHTFALCSIVPCTSSLNPCWTVNSKQSWPQRVPLTLTMHDWLHKLRYTTRRVKNVVTPQLRD